MHYVYLLRSVSDGGFYIGYTANLRKRFAQHAKGASLATSHRGPWKLIYYEAYLNQEDALGRVLKQCWAAKLERDFPHRRFEVQFDDTAAADASDYEITFYQQR